MHLLPRHFPAVSTATCAVCLAVMGCAPALRQFFADTYYEQDRVYENRALGFTIGFVGDWIIDTDPRDMDDAMRRADRQLQANGGELLFCGYTAEGTQAARGIVEHLNESDSAYLALLRTANAKSLETDLGDTLVMMGNRLGVKWEYLCAGFHYAEFIFKCGTYNCRVAFWTKPGLFDRFLPVYEDIMASLNVTNPARY